MSVGTFALFSSCGSDDNNNAPTKPTIANGCKITRIVFTGGDPYNAKNISIVYDDKDRIINAIANYPNYTQRSEFVYDENSDRVKEILRTQGQEDLGKIVFSYNSNGQIVESKRYNDKDVLRDNLIYQYNSAGELTQEIVYFFYGTNTYTDTYSFQWSGGNCVKTEYEYDESGGVKGSYEKEYSSMTNNMPKYVMDLLGYLLRNDEIDYELYMSKNLVQKVTNKNDNESDDIYNYTYTLTDKGLIDTIKGTKSDSDYNFEYRFEYSCQ